MGRIIILLILAMITYFTIKSVFKRPRMPEPKPPDPRIPPKDDIYPDRSDMAQDPVCGTFVEPETALFIIHGDIKIFFCSDECRKKFLAGLN